VKQQRPIEDLTKSQFTGMLWKWRLLFVAIFFGPAIYFGSEGDYVLSAVIATAGFSAFTGFRMGAMAMITSVAAIALAVTYAPSIAYQHQLRFTEWFGTTGLLNRFISIAAVGLSITIISSSIAILITGKLLSTRPTLDRSNRWLGFWIGGVEGVITAFILFGGVLILEPIEQDRTRRAFTQTARGKQISRLVLATAQQTRDSQIGPYIEQYNPFVRFPELNKIEQVQKSVQILSDPKKIQRILERPEVRELQSRPEVRIAVEKVMKDPGIRNALRSGGPMNRSTALMLLNHPAILELIDQPGFLAAATKAIRNANVVLP